MATEFISLRDESARTLGVLQSLGKNNGMSKYNVKATHTFCRCGCRHWGFVGDRGRGAGGGG